MRQLAKLPRDQFPGAPIEVRLGKMPNSLESKDHKELGEVGWSRCDWFRILGSAK
jgi:hypothetical protein